MAINDKKYVGASEGMDMPSGDDLLGGASAEAAAGEDPTVAAAGESEPTDEMSEKDRFKGRIAADYPDLDMDDEDAYYKAANDRYDELGSYRESTKNLRDALDLDSDGTGMFNEMIMEASRQKDFDPIIFLVERHGLDLDALRDDPDYAKKLGEAREKYLNELSEGAKISEEFEANAPASMDAINAYCEENGVSEEDKKDTIGKMYDIMDNLVVGKMPVELFEFVLKGGKYDAAVEEANEAGKLEGRSQKVSDKLMKLDNNDRIGGRQESYGGQAPGGNSIFALAAGAR